MKKQLLVLLAAAIAGCSYAQTTKIDLATYNLKGKVKSVNAASYEAIEKFGEMAKGTKTGREYNEFNNAGLETQYLEETYDDGEKEKFVRTTRYENSKVVESKEELDDEVAMARFKYNQQGLVESSDLVGSKGNLMRRQKNKYSNGDLLTQADIYEADGSLLEKTLSSYNTKKQLVKEELYDKDGKQTSLYTYVYDSRGNMVEKSATNYQKKEPKPYVCKYAFNDKGQKTEERNSIAGLDKKHVYEYNAEGDEVRHEDQYGWEQKKVYTYDGQHNWIKRITSTTTSSGSTTHEITERQVKYY